MPLEVARSVIDQKFAVVGVEFFAESVNYLLKNTCNLLFFNQSEAWLLGWLIALFPLVG